MAFSLPDATGRFSWTDVNAALSASVADLSRSLMGLEARLCAAGEDTTLAQLGERAGELASLYLI